MTFLGKLLIVIQVVLSICFMLFAGAVYSVQTSWKDEAASLNEQVQAVQGQMDTLQGEYDDYRTQMNAELKQAQDDAQRAQAEATGLANQLEITRQELETTRTERDNQRALAQIAGEEARARRDEAQQLRTVNGELYATLDGLNSKIRQLEDEIFNKNLTVEQISDKHQELLSDLALLKEVLRRNNLDDDPSAYAALQEPPPIVEGYVLTKKAGKGTSPDFVQISLGSDDGLLKGHELYVYRPSDSKYLGKIRIVRLDPDKSVGIVIDRAKNGIIEIGDNVSTKL